MLKSPEQNGPLPRRENVALLAYALYIEEGQPEGQADAHWFNAESMLMNNQGQWEEPDWEHFPASA